MLIHLLQSQHRKKTIAWVGGLSQLALVSSLLLSHFGNDSLAFLNGLLLGLSIPGNLFTIYVLSTRKKGEEDA